MNLEDIEKKINPCKYCGNIHPMVYHQDYVGDIYIGDEYMIECDCGICTGWFKLDELFKVWNK